MCGTALQTALATEEPDHAQPAGLHTLAYTVGCNPAWARPPAMQEGLARWHWIKTLLTKEYKHTRTLHTQGEAHMGTTADNDDDGTNCK